MTLIVTFTLIRDSIVTLLREKRISRQRGDDTVSPPTLLHTTNPRIPTLHSPTRPLLNSAPLSLAPIPQFFTRKCPPLLASSSPLTVQIPSRHPTPYRPAHQPPPALHLLCHNSIPYQSTCTSSTNNSNPFSALLTPPPPPPPQPPWSASEWPPALTSCPCNPPTSGASPRTTN